MESSQLIIVCGLLVFVLGIISFYYVKDREKNLSLKTPNKKPKTVRFDNKSKEEVKVVEVESISKDNTPLRSPTRDKVMVENQVAIPNHDASSHGTNNLSITKEIEPLPDLVPLPATPRKLVETFRISTPSTTSSQTPRFMSESKANTKFDMDEFILRLFKTAFLVKRVKGDEKKLRCIKINEYCQICLYKTFVENDSAILPTGQPYIVLPISELSMCFPCDDGKGRTFILEFKQRLLQLETTTLLDANYLVSGFESLAARVKYDKIFLNIWREKFVNILVGNKAHSTS